MSLRVLPGLPSQLRSRHKILRAKFAINLHVMAGLVPAIHGSSKLNYSAALGCALARSPFETVHWTVSQDAAHSAAVRLARFCAYIAWSARAIATSGLSPDFNSKAP